MIMPLTEWVKVSQNWGYGSSVGQHYKDCGVHKSIDMLIYPDVMLRIQPIIWHSANNIVARFVYKFSLYTDITKTCYISSISSRSLGLSSYCKEYYLRDVFILLFKKENSVPNQKLPLY